MGHAQIAVTLHLSGVLIRQPAELRLDSERAGCIVHRHEHLYELDLIRPSKRLVVEQFRELALRFDSVRLAGLAFGAAKGRQERRPFPVQYNAQVSHLLMIYNEGKATL